MTVLLVLLALVAGFIGAALASQATLGVVVVCWGVLLAVLARLAQASSHHSALLREARDLAASAAAKREA